MLLSNVPAPLQDLARNPPADLSGTLLPPHLGVLKLEEVQGKLRGQGAACCCVALLRKDGTGERAHVCCSWVGMHSFLAPPVELGARAGVSSQGT